MSAELALVADAHEWLLMHQECAHVVGSTYWYAADVIHPVADLLNDRCGWCQFRLKEDADPHLEVKPRPAA